MNLYDKVKKAIETFAPQLDDDWGTSTEMTCLIMALLYRENLINWDIYSQQSKPGPQSSIFLPDYDEYWKSYEENKE